MKRKVTAAFSALLLSGCAAPYQAARVEVSRPVEVQILAINDFHGNIETPPDPPSVSMSSGTTLKRRLGGAAQLAAALSSARRGHANTITVAAGDLIGASPLASAYFLDEPTIDALNLVGLTVASVGNHEFDKGSAELLRMQHGGCGKNSSRVPCRLERFAGARFQYLAANVVRGDGTGIFPATAVRQLGPMRIGFIGETLKETGVLVSPAGVAGLRFIDEAAAANSLVPQLKAQGVDAIVLLIHQGGKVPDTYEEQGCNAFTGDILRILDKLDPAVTTIISGHTHNAYACTLHRGGVDRLVTSAGKYGFLYTDVRLTFDPATRRIVNQRAANVPVDPQLPDARVAKLVQRYAKAVQPVADRIVGRLSGSAVKTLQDGESPVADLIADAQLAATSSDARGKAELSFINTGGARTDLIPGADGNVTYGQIFALEPFGNMLVVRSFTGEQLKSLLEQQFPGSPTASPRASTLVPSSNFHYTYDLSRPEGGRIVSMSLAGRPIDPAGRYRVVVNNFLASGGDGYSVLTQGVDPFDAGLDLDALEAWLGTNPALPPIDRIRNVTPR